MDYITLDFETPYSAQYSLKKLTYEQYINHELFDVHGVGIKINDEPVQYYYRGVSRILHDLFYPSNDHVLICHNTMFDGAVLSWYYGLHAGQYLCTERMSKALWNQRSASLDSLSKKLFPDGEYRKGDELADFKGKFELSDEEQTVLGSYCKNDVEVTWQCFKKMWKFMPESELKALDITLRMFIHPEFVLDRNLVTEYQKQIETNRKTLIRESGLEADVLASNDKFAQWIIDQGIEFERVPSPTPLKPNNTKWPLAKTAPEFISLQANYPELSHVWEARLAVKSTIERTRARRLLEHAQPSPLNPQGRIAMPLNYAAAHTLRFGGTNKVNPQNFGRESPLRPALQAPPGYRVLIADLSNIELRMAAWFAGEQQMLDSFRAKEDLYCKFASDVFGRPITKENELERFVGKTCILGLQYQTGGPKLRTTLATGPKKLAISEEEAKRIVRLYRSKYRNIPALWRRAEKWIRDMCNKHLEPYTYKCIRIEPGRILGPSGMYLNYPDIRIETDPYDNPVGVSYYNGKHRTDLYGGKLIENIIQHLARCVIVEHMLEVEEYLSRQQGRVVLQVHDELVSIAPNHLAETAFDRVLTIMRNVPAWCDDGSLVLDAEGLVADNYAKH